VPRNRRGGGDIRLAAYVQGIRELVMAKLCLSELYRVDTAAAPYRIAANPAHASTTGMRPVSAKTAAPGGRHRRARS